MLFLTASIRMDAFSVGVKETISIFDIISLEMNPLPSNVPAMPTGSFDNAIIRSRVRIKIALTSGDGLDAIFSGGPGSEL